MSVTFYGRPEGAEVNVSNHNASRLLRSLGVDFDYCGQIDAADLKGRVLTAMTVGGANIVDTADRASKEVLAALSGGGACVMDMTGPLDEYLDRRLPFLLAVCEEAEADGVPVTWA